MTLTSEGAIDEGGIDEGGIDEGGIDRHVERTLVAEHVSSRRLVRKPQRPCRCRTDRLLNASTVQGLLWMSAC